MVGWVAGFFGLIGRTLPDLNHAFRALRRFLGTRLEATVGQAVYRWLSSTDFPVRPSREPCAPGGPPGARSRVVGSRQRVPALRPGMAALRDEIAGPTMVAAAAG